MITQEMAEKAADWWVEKLRKPEFKSGNLDMDVRVASLLVQFPKPSPSEDTLSLFRGLLVQAIMAEQPTRLYVGYQPIELLADVATLAGIESMFPWKTALYFERGKIVVQEGYSTGWKEL